MKHYYTILTRLVISQLQIQMLTLMAIIPPLHLYCLCLQRLSCMV